MKMHTFEFDSLNITLYMFCEFHEYISKGVNQGYLVSNMHNDDKYTINTK